MKAHFGLTSIQKKERGRAMKKRYVLYLLILAFVCIALFTITRNISSVVGREPEITEQNKEDRVPRTKGPTEEYTSKESNRLEDRVPFTGGRP